MKFYGATPPWEKELDYGRWVWVAPDPDSWTDEPGYWELNEPRSVWTRMLDKIPPLYRNQYVMATCTPGFPIPRIVVADPA